VRPDSLVRLAANVGHLEPAAGAGLVFFCFTGNRFLVTGNLFLVAGNFFLVMTQWIAPVPYRTTKNTLRSCQTSEHFWRYSEMRCLIRPMQIPFTGTLIILQFPGFYKYYCTILNDSFALPKNHFQHLWVSLETDFYLLEIYF
jgi:hypothetical protein